jgi:hypothetical protein
MLCLTSLYIGLALDGGLVDPLPLDDLRPDFVGSLDSSAYPIRCHYADAGKADTCAIVISSAEAAWATQVDELGFRAPEPDGDGILDFYISNEGTEGGAYTLGSYFDADPLDHYLSCPSFVVLDPSIPDVDIPSFVVHEFQHVSQYATDFMEATLPVWEAVATETERYNLDDGSVLAYQIADFQETPWLGLLGDGYILYDRDGTWSEYEYGAVLWILDLNARLGLAEGEAAQLLWETLAQGELFNEPDVLDAWEVLTGDWRQSLLDLNVLRAQLGTAAAPDWESYLNNGGMRVTYDEELDAPALPVDLTPSPRPWPTGSVFARFTGLTPGQPLRLTVTADEDATFGLVVVEADRSLTSLDPQLEFTPAAAELDIVVVNFGPDGYDADQDWHGYGYTLRVEVATPAGDTGEEPEPDTDAPKAEPADRPADKGGCGCAQSGGGGLYAALSGLLLLARRSARMRSRSASAASRSG